MPMQYLDLPLFQPGGPRHPGRQVQMGLSEGELGDIYPAGLLHDIGKIGVRDEILRKPGGPTPEEMARLQQHTVVGDRMIGGMRQLGHLRPGVRSHHERFDGKGYPDGLAGEDIPPTARVLSVPDACDAMMSDRPYRRAMPTDRIDGIIAEEAGGMWDPAIVGSFMACRRDLYPILRRGIGESVAAAVEQVIVVNTECSSISVRKRG